MKICDKCFHQNGDSVSAVAEVMFNKTQERYDLCQSCNELVREFINNPRVETENIKLKEDEPEYVARLEALPDTPTTKSGKPDKRYKPK